MCKQFISIRGVKDNSSVTIYHVSDDWVLTRVNKRFNSIQTLHYDVADVIELKLPAVVLHNNDCAGRYISTYGEFPQIPEADSNLLIFDQKNEDTTNVIHGDKIRYAGYLLGLCACVRVPRDGNWIKINRTHLNPINKLSHGLEFACYRNNELFVSRIAAVYSDNIIHRISEDDDKLHIGTKIDNTKGDDAYNWIYLNTIRESRKLSPSM